MRIVTIEDFTNVDKFLALAKDVYEANKAKGFWDKERSPEHCLMLVISEIAEAVEAARKGGNALNVAQYKELVEAGPEAIYQRKAEFKDTVIDEMADTVIRCLDIIGYIESLGVLDDAMTYFRHQTGELKKKLSMPKNIDSLDIDGFMKFCFMLAQDFEVEGWDEYIAVDCTSVVCDILDYIDQCHRTDLMPEAITTKLAYNAQRPRLHGKAF